ncbi:MAG TPA: DUF2807 domain-containing protein [Cyclobacteriaceae bacterium]|nr:DUF2807 domain-containing protein [Cyclobacteriaceae bacterium]
MKAFSALLTVTLMATIAYSQDIEQKLRPFDKIVVSHKIDLVLIPGDTESIRITYSGVDSDKIIIGQSGHRVHVYLEDAKIFDKGEKRHNMFDRRPRYKFASVTAYVTFKSLRLIETRGEGEVFCDGRISSKKLMIRAYGDTDIRLAYVEAQTVKARMYGDNTMKIREGEAGHVNYKLFGDNKVDSRGLESVTSNTTIYGDGRVALNATEEVRFNSFGDPSLFVFGSPTISKGIMIGEADIRRN